MNAWPENIAARAAGPGGERLMESPLPDWWLVAARLHRRLVADIPKPEDRQAVLLNLLSFEADLITAPQPAPVAGRVA